MVEPVSHELFRKMSLIRAFENEVALRFRQGLLPGFVHLSSGQEAVAVGVASALTPDDVIATTHRGHGHVIAKGAALRKLTAELYGSPEGACHGLGGSMHLVDLDAGVLSAGAIVGGTIPLAVGAAFSFAALGRPHVAVCFFGDGAVNEGIFHEALNLASLWQLPVIFVCENNGYAEMTPMRVHTRVERLSAHGELYGMHTITVNGNDVEAVAAAAASAVANARRGAGPALLECLTYRTRGHFEGDPQKYKPAEEIEGWKAREPLLSFRRVLLRRGEATEAELDALSKAAEAEVQAAFADLSGETDLTVADLRAATLSWSREVTA
jgi:acetoin:2,6-dichlorophenolindophenol oxidoreductase subunit alpha